MDYRREIEKKFVITNTNYNAAYEFLSTLPRTEVVEKTQTGWDMYWEAPFVDFVRLRESSRELTIKITDKTTITDRVEESARIQKEDMGSIGKIMSLLFGRAVTLRKTFSVFTVTRSPAPGTDFRAIICLYMVEGDPLRRLFFEVEADNEAIVNHVVEGFKVCFDLKLQTKSLYQIFTESR